jgi:hypothetical protein
MNADSTMRNVDVKWMMKADVLEVGFSISKYKLRLHLRRDSGRYQTVTTHCADRN